MGALGSYAAADLVVLAVAAFAALLSLAVAVAAARTRAMLLLVLFAAASAMLASLALFLAGEPRHALTVMAIGGLLGPAALVGAVFLTVRAAPAQARWRDAPAFAIATLLLAAIGWVLLSSPELAAAPPRGHALAAVGPGVAALLLVAVVGCAGLLGAGERSGMHEDFQP